MAELDELERSEWHDLSEDERERRRKAFVSMRMEQREQELKSNELRQRKGKKRAESQTEGSMLSDDDRSMEDDDGKTKADGRQGEWAVLSFIYECTRYTRHGGVY